MTQQDGAPSPQRARRADRLFGAAAQPSAPRPEQVRPVAPTALRRAAAVVGLQALAVAVLAVVWLWLTLTGDAESIGRALAEVAIIALVAVGLGFAARGLWRVSGWARGPVVAAQIFFGLSGFVAAFEAERPLIGLPILVVVAVELYLLATPEARLAYFER